MSDIQIVHNNRRKTMVTKNFTVPVAAWALDFHESFPEYKRTPLVSLRALSAACGASEIWVKDESKRFDLNAFKVLGGSYCLSRYLTQQLGRKKALSFQELAEAGDWSGTTLITTTDGNHGHGVAWAANRLGCRCIVKMPKGSSEHRLERIRSLGAEAEITDCNYDDTVRLTAQLAQENGWILMQDTSWPGYEDIPRWIMQGYTSMGMEAVEQIGNEMPTHIFLQAGVGAMAGALTGFFRSYYGDRPRIIIVESDQAGCLYETARADDGKIHTVGGDLATIMAGLACGEPCTLGWDLLVQGANSFVTVPDGIAAQGMRILGRPLGDDRRIISGESGAVTMGLVCAAYQNPELKWLKKELGLNARSRILCYSTEGDTDPESYQKILNCER